MNNKKMAIIFSMRNMEDAIHTEQSLKVLFGIKVLKKCFVFLFFILSACNLSTSTMTPTAYEQIPIGASVAEIESLAGTPYRITSEGEVNKYLYIERIQIAPNHHAQNNYTLIIRDGRVIDKKRSK